jgi:phosphate transport system permease protein
MNSRAADRIATAALWGIAGSVVLLLLCMVGYLLKQGLPAINLHFLTAPPETLRAGGGIGPQLFNSLYLLLLSLAITVPIGLGAAIYLSEYATHGKLVEYVRVATDTLASLPSIVVGLFGLLIFVGYLKLGYSLLAGALALTVLNLPAMVNISLEALRTVPREVREGSLALGATRWQTIWGVVLPLALPGLITGIVLTAGRVFGEAAALIYTAGMSSPALRLETALDPLRPGATLAVHIWKINAEGLVPDARLVGDGSAAVLVLAVLGFNLAARVIGARLQRS